MAVIKAVEYPFNPGSGFRNARLFIWSGVAFGDICESVMLGGYTDRTIQAVGDFGVGGKVAIKGTLKPDGQNMVPVTDPQGTNIEITDDQLETIAEATVHTQPVVIAGDGSTLLDILLFMNGKQ